MDRFGFSVTRTWCHYLLVAVIYVFGCGTMKNHVATEQLLVSDAIERAVDQFDFSPLANSTVYLDTQYMAKVTTQGFLNSDYISSALRERLMMANCYIKDSAEDAEFVVEVRVGVLGTDAHEINYGIPASQPLTTTASLLTGGGVIPSLPEVSLAKKDERRGAAKLHLFAYNRETMQAVWQPEVAYGRSTARSLWVFGAGPFEKGTIYDKTQFAGAPLEALELQPLGVKNLSTLAKLRPNRGTDERPDHAPAAEPGLLARLLPHADKRPPVRDQENHLEKPKREKVTIDRVDELRAPSVATDEVVSDRNQVDHENDESSKVEKVTVEFSDDENSQP